MRLVRRDVIDPKAALALWLLKRSGAARGPVDLSPIRFCEGYCAKILPCSLPSNNSISRWFTDGRSASKMKITFLVRCHPD
jgi:hypothetical protein